LLTACGSGGGRTGATTATTTSTTPTSTTAAPATAPAAAVVSGFVTIGDCGGGPRQDDIAAAMERWSEHHRVDAITTVGDNVYPTGSPSAFAAQLDEPYARLRAGGRPLWVTLGNHDVASGHGREQLVHLGLPALPYARTLPGAQLLFVDANHPDEAQAAWLDQQLGADGPPLRFVFMHQPAYSCGLHGSTSSVRQRWVPVLERHGTTLVLAGHDHDYERFAASDAGVTYVVTGGGGRELYPFAPVCEAGLRSAARALTHEFLGVEVRGDGTATATAVAADGSVLDRFELPAQRAGR
jgi:hypothetical protein